MLHKFGYPDRRENKHVLNDPKLGREKRDFCNLSISHQGRTKEKGKKELLYLALRL